MFNVTALLNRFCLIFNDVMFVTAWTCHSTLTSQHDIALMLITVER